MKIVIDVDKLLEEGRITTEEYERLNALTVQETGALAFNILIGFGVIATAGGALALLPSGPTAMLLGSSCQLPVCFFPRRVPKSGGCSVRCFSWSGRSPLRAGSSS